MSPQSSAPSAAPANGAAVFDVRPIPCRVKHGLIFRRWFDLPVGGHFILLNDHDPIPLRYQFEAEFPGAFTWDYLERGPEEFRVRITKLAPVTEPARPNAPPVAICGAAAASIQELDVRGLEPPEPLVRILDALESLPPDGELRARTDREPCHLFGEATQRGFQHECREQPDGSWLTTLARA